MKINSATFIQSEDSYLKGPKDGKAEYAFIGRSNVGKSSLINMIASKKGLAKTSQTPGKTQTINHFLINEEWYLVDLPGYGFAKPGKDYREKWEVMIIDYLTKRENLFCIFVLIDSRHPLQDNDFEFMRFLAHSELPFAILFTKSDKNSVTKTKQNVDEYIKLMLEYWEELPQCFLTSSVTREGKEEILNFIEDLNKKFKKK